MMCIVTPWWNHHELEKPYREVIGDCPQTPFVIIDNASEPPLDFSDIDRVTVMREPHNVGFSRACNDGFMIAESLGATVVVFLNNDVVLRESGAFVDLASTVEPGVLVGAELRAGRHTDVDDTPIPYLDGWCVGGMVSDLKKLDEGCGLWDERYAEPSYYGDNDLSLRARAAGMHLVEVHAGLRHIGNTSSRAFDVTGVAEQNRQRYVARARELLTLETKEKA